MSDFRHFKKQIIDVHYLPNTLFHFPLFWFLSWIYDGLSLSHRAKLNLAGVLPGQPCPRKPPQRYQCICPTTLVCSRWLQMWLPSFEVLSLCMVPPLELALKSVPVQIFLFTEFYLWLHWEKAWACLCGGLPFIWLPEYLFRSLWKYIHRAVVMNSYH